MDKKLFPRTMVEDISLPRMLIGSNWVCGYSHRSDAADRMIKSRFDSKEAFFPILETFLNNGIDAVMGLLTVNPLLKDGIYYAQEKTGKKSIL